MTTLIQRVLIAILISMALSSTGYAANRIHYVINNHLGAPEMLIDEDQHVVWQAEYDEFGKATILVEEVEFNHRFPGQYYDKETGLTYNYYRDYDAENGRYYQSDPIGLAGGINTYGYVGGNPVNYVDPTGEFEVTPAGQAMINSLARGSASTALVDAAIPDPSDAAWPKWACYGAAIGVTALLSSSVKCGQCEDAGDDCSESIANINALVEELKSRYLDMLVDEYGLFINHYYTWQKLQYIGSWQGHLMQYNQVKIRLHKAIDIAAAKGCPIPASAYSWLSKPAPRAPTLSKR